MVLWTPIPMVYQTSTHGIMTLQAIVYQTPYPWYIEPPIHIKPSINSSLTPTCGLLNSLPMVYRTSYLWYFEPLPMVK